VEIWWEGGYKSLYTHLGYGPNTRGWRYVSLLAVCINAGNVRPTGRSTCILMHQTDKKQMERLKISTYVKFMDYILLQRVKRNCGREATGRGGVKKGEKG